MNELHINLLRPEKVTPPPAPEPPKKRLFLYFAIFLGLAVLGWLIYKSYVTARWPSDPVAYDPITLRPKNMGILQSVSNFFFSSDRVVQTNDDRINIALFGIGGAGHDGPFLTDTNIILSVKPEAKEAALISVPRDLGVTIGGALRKINYADAWGEANNPGQGGDYARALFAKTFGLPIPYYVRVDFTAFKDLVDIVGGVNINVTRPFVDTEFPGPDYSFQTVIFNAGEQTMDGQRALEYARSRHGGNGEGSDFARSRRQQQVISALKEKLLSSQTYTNPIRLKQIYDTLRAHVDTNLDFGQIIYLISVAKEINLGQIKTLVLDDSPQGFLYSNTVGGSFLLFPKSGDFKNINAAIANVFSATTTAAAAPAQTAVLPAAKIEIQNGTWLPGLASKAQQKLAGQGLTAETIGNSRMRPVATTTIYLVKPNVNREIVTVLEQILHAPATSTLPAFLNFNFTDPKNPASAPGAKFATDTEILVVLGEDANQ